MNYLFVKLKIEFRRQTSQANVPELKAIDSIKIYRSILVTTPGPITTNLGTDGTVSNTNVITIIPTDSLTSGIISTTNKASTEISGISITQSTEETTSESPITHSILQRETTNNPDINK